MLSVSLPRRMLLIASCLLAIASVKMAVASPFYLPRDIRTAETMRKHDIRSAHVDTPDTKFVARNFSLAGVPNTNVTHLSLSLSFSDKNQVAGEVSCAGDGEGNQGTLSAIGGYCVPPPASNRSHAESRSLVHRDAEHRFSFSLHQETEAQQGASSTWHLLLEYAEPGTTLFYAGDHVLPEGEMEMVEASDGRATETWIYTGADDFEVVADRRDG